MGLHWLCSQPIIQEIKDLTGENVSAWRLKIPSGSASSREKYLIMVWDLHMHVGCAKDTTASNNLYNMNLMVKSNNCKERQHPGLV